MMRLQQAQLQMLGLTDSYPRISTDMQMAQSGRVSTETYVSQATHFSQ